MAAIAAVNALTEGTTDVGTLAVTDFEVVATKEVPLYVSKTTVTVPLVLLGNQLCSTTSLNVFVPAAKLIVFLTVEPVLSMTLWLNAVEDGDTAPDNAAPVLMLDGTVKLEDLGIVGSVIVELTDIVPT